MLKRKKLTCRIVRHFVENCNDNGFSNFRFSIIDCLSNVEGLTDDEIDDLLLFCIRASVTQHHGLNSKHDFTLSWRRPLSYTNQPIHLLSQSMDWFLYDNILRHERVKQKKAMQAQKVKPLDIENDYMYHKKAQYVENFNEFLIMIFLNIVFQTRYEKMFYCKKRIRLTKLICIPRKY